MNPTRLEIGAVRFEVGDPRNADALELALGAQDVHEALRFRPRVAIPIEVHNVIEVTRSRPLGERPEFLGERFDIVVGENRDSFLGRVAIWVEDLRKHRR
ncbi:MAG: hypothetical protein E6447_24135, partial [Bradyrhizobium sp.]|nr:hypothetical protein [Bradyrhizobium sp.]